MQLPGTGAYKRWALVASVVVALFTGGTLGTWLTVRSTQSEREQTLGFRELDRLIDEIARQDARLLSQEARLATLLVRINDLDTQLRSRFGEIVQLNARITELEAEVRQRNQVIEDLRAQLLDLRAVLNPGEADEPPAPLPE